MKRTMTLFLAAVLLFSIVNCLPLTASADTAVDPTKYTYEVIPLLEPFNVYFFVKTENPDPSSFRFADHDSVYSVEGEPGVIEAYDYFDDIFADVIYENMETMRVKGGYIFWSGYADTDGGKITLQTALYNRWGWCTGWEDTDQTLVIPALRDDVDYLIDTFSKGDGFFEKMDAIQEGLQTICLYSGSYIRGELVQSKSYWSLSRSPYIDQFYYMYSPYTRENTQRLFATSLFPFFRDSLGFPSTMGRVALRLDKSATYQWSSSSHAYIDVTYNGETRTYGGQGIGEGQSITKDKIKKYFTFGNDNMGITFEGLRELQNEYAQIVMEDDVPRDNALTWKIVNDTVGENGAWVCFQNGYTYLYKKDDWDGYSTSEFDDIGSSLYWDGSLGCPSNTWIDGRHISKWSMLEPGATFEEYPNDKIVLTDAVYPVFTFRGYYIHDWKTGTYHWEYQDVEVTECTGFLEYDYNPEENTWDVNPQYTYNEDGTRTEVSYEIAAALAEQGLIDESYIDILRLTYDRVIEMDVDRNTDLVPAKGLIYNGDVAPGTPFDNTLLDVEDPSVLFEDAKALAEKNGLNFRLDEGNYGICGNPMYWVYLQDSQTLLITGTGAMYMLEQAPWRWGELPIKQVLIGEGVEALPDQEFYLCSQIEAISLPTTLKKIGWDAFSHCGLKKIEIPANVESMGGSVFSWCDSLTDIYCLAKTQPEGWSEDWLGNCDAAVHWGTAMPCEHAHTTTNRKEPTCTEAGYVDEVCDICKEVLLHTVLPATGHKYQNGKCTVCGVLCEHTHTTVNRKEPTCTEAGYVDEVCDNCKEVLSHEDLPAAGHKYQNGTCTVCGMRDPDARMLGDLTNDGKIKATDYLLLKRHVLGTFALTEEQLLVADVNHDNRVNATDYMMVKRHVLGTYRIS